MKVWKRRFHKLWVTTDHKPKGKDRQYIEKQNRDMMLNVILQNN